MNILKQYLIEISLPSSSKKTFSRLKDLTPVLLKKLDNKILLDYHRKCHMLYQAHIKWKDRDFINSIVDIHDMIVKEMERRRFKHKSPLKKI